MKNKRIAEKCDEIMPKKGKLRGIKSKMKNRRMILATDGDHYFLYFKNLTKDGKIGKLSFCLTKEAMFNLIVMYEDLDGPLPDNVELLRYGVEEKS